MKKNDENKKKKGIGIRLYAFVTLILAFMIAACVFLLVFRVQKIHITGNEYCEEQMIEDWVMQDVSLRNSILALWKNKYGQMDPPEMIKSIKVSLAAPWALHVAVQEEEIIGYFEQDGQYIYFDCNGYVLEQSDELYENAFLVSGLGDLTVKKGEQLETAEENVFGEIAEISAALKEQELTPSVIQTAADGLTLQFGTVSVKMGTAEYQEKTAQLSEILKRLKGETGTLHMEKYSSSSETVWFTKS